MRLFLVRHGESVDNVAGLYAGWRDSALTAHGVLQTRRLATHLAALPMTITAIFSSDLQRAFLTASAIRGAPRSDDVGEATDGEVNGSGCEVGCEVVQLADLRERDYRSGEGVPFRGGRGGSGGRDALADAETLDEMRVRAARFVDGYLEPLWRVPAQAAGEAVDERAVVVVSHGAMLNVLLALLLQRHAPAELARLLPQPPQPSNAATASRRAELRILWRNTGYVDMAVSVGAAVNGQEADKGALQMQVVTVNGDSHLVGLKKTRGGIGSAQFDAKQKTMHAFFAPAAKRQKGDDA